MLAGWLGKRDFRCLARDATRTLTPPDRPGGLKALLIKTGPTSAWVVEARAEGNPDGCRRDGLLVYRVRTRADLGPVRVVDSAPPPEDCFEHGDATFVPGGRTYASRNGGFTPKPVGRSGDEFTVTVDFTRK